MTRLIEILISLAIVAALFVIVGVMLPASRHLEHSAETNRKLTIVYDTLNSFRRFKDWNPLVLRDPRVQIKLSGPESGVGARLDYESQERGIGTGSWEIVASEPGKRVAYKIESVEPGRNKRSEFTFRPTGRGGRNIQITQTYDVDYGWNLIGRYAGLYVSSNVGEDMKLGLGRLSNMLAAVPNYDYAELSKDDASKAPKIVQRDAENVLALTAVVERTNEKVMGQMKINQEWIKKNMEANGLEAAGPVRIVTNEFGSENYSFDVVQPVRKAGETGPATKLDIKTSNNVVAEFHEPAKVAVAQYKGHMANLPRVRDSLRAWALTHGYETVDRPYEIWKNGIDAGFTEEGDFEVVWAVK
ncbi:SRPBCC family protein [Vulcaniibacterium tengchongense]|uniref:Polyketide cyclase/dehydrase/lipid transport protein n=1 Tax=Vulcaniibacterium tengchongense TaxID=1273429 RepID=A0A3N4VBW9_9GAMM|nr:SRPBCC family protein [Vulcaniibacterium tengchongense]RPE77119.1 polyketide cyclase/dehydrase/lipid transport protein [Vulcaniibacterium tengchongense]